MIIYKLSVSEEARFCPDFDDAAIKHALVILPETERSKFIASYERPLTGRLVPSHRQPKKPDMKSCDLYTYGGLYFFFSERAVTILANMRGFMDHLIPVAVENRQTPLYMHYMDDGKRLVQEDSEFKTTITIGGVSLPQFLMRARFFPGTKIDLDIFGIQRPVDIVAPPRHLMETFVTDRFSEEWRRAELIGAQFTNVGELPD